MVDVSTGHEHSLGPLVNIVATDCTAGRFQLTTLLLTMLLFYLDYGQFFDG